MEIRVQQKLEKLNRKHERHLILTRILAGLVCLTVFFTTYALILPAITMDENSAARCGLVAHEHGNDCFDEYGNLICGLREHEHDTGCFAEKTIPSPFHCGFDYEHVHTNACYDANGKKICSLQEHSHTAACMSVTTRLAAIGRPLMSAAAPVKPQEPSSELGGKTETTTLDTFIEGIAYSDPTTVLLQKRFKAMGKDANGMVLADKSVVYGEDPFQVFSSVGQNEFTTALSVMAQGYDLAVDLETTAPMDIVLVLDVSTSMTYGMTNNKSQSSKADTRMYQLVNAVNKFLKAVFEQNPNNRVGIVLFGNPDTTSSNKAFLPLASYQSTGDYLDFGYNSDKKITLTVSNKVKRKDDTSFTHSSYTQPSSGYVYTHTQAGLYYGIDMLKNATNTSVQEKKTVTFADGSTSDVTYSVTRMPVLFLVTDGVPTYYNDKSDMSGTDYKGSEKKDNSPKCAARAIETYLQFAPGVENTYNGRDLLTFGLGIMDSGNENYEFMETFMHPTPTNIEGTDGWVQELKKEMNGRSLLSKDYTYTVASSVSSEGSDKIVETMTGYTTGSERSKLYGVILKGATGVTISDPIGTGMKVLNDELILDYNGTKITGKKTTSSGKVSYVFQSSDPKTYDGDLAIRAEIVTATDGSQTVNFYVPDEFVPLRVPDLKDPAKYTDTAPVRLLYKVGLNSAAEAELKKLTYGNSKTYYTNRYSGTAATASFVPTKENPYYKNYTGESPINKKTNTTNTAATSSTYAFDKTSGTFSMTLGNNGKLTFHSTVMNELPATGGMTELPYVITGASLLCASFIFAIILIRKRERRASKSV